MQSLADAWLDLRRKSIKDSSVPADMEVLLRDMFYAGACDALRVYVQMRREGIDEMSAASSLVSETATYASNLGRKATECSSFRD